MATVTANRGPHGISVLHPISSTSQTPPTRRSMSAMICVHRGRSQRVLRTASVILDWAVAPHLPDLLDRLRAGGAGQLLLEHRAPTAHRSEDEQHVGRHRTSLSRGGPDTGFPQAPAAPRAAAGQPKAQPRSDVRMLTGPTAGETGPGDRALAPQGAALPPWHIVRRHRAYRGNRLVG